MVLFIKEGKIIDYINEFESDDLSIVLKEKYETYLKA